MDCKLVCLIILIFLIGCYDDFEGNEDHHTISTTFSQPAEDTSCHPGKMSCIENKSMLCYEGEWILVDDCNLTESICHFNEPELSYNIPYFAICVIE
jgi:hypothetical protein